jgi:hypothetical protein
MSIAVKLRPDLENGIILIPNEGLICSLIGVHDQLIRDQTYRRFLEEHPVLRESIKLVIEIKVRKLPWSG